MTDEQPQSPQPQPPASGGTIGSSSTAILTTLESLRGMVIASVVLSVVVIVALIGTLLVTRSDLAATNDRLTALQASIATAAPAPQATAQPQATEQAAPAGITPAVALTGVELMPKGADETGAFLLGNPAAKDVVEVFVDMQCPFCQKWHKELGRTLEEKALADGSDLLVRVNHLAFLGESDRDLTNPGASARAANALACVADVDGVPTMSALATAIYAAADPAEPAGQFPTEQLQELATGAGASEGALTCIADERFVPFVAAVTKAGFARGVQGTPTVIVNGVEAANAFTASEVLGLVG